MTITTKLRTEAAQTHTRLIAATTTAYNTIAAIGTTNLNTTKTEPIPTINIYTPTGEHIANHITYALNKHANN